MQSGRRLIAIGKLITLEKSWREYVNHLILMWMDVDEMCFIGLGEVEACPEEGSSTLPGMHVVCGDSHSKYHGGYLGALAFGMALLSV